MAFVYGIRSIVSFMILSYLNIIRESQGQEEILVYYRFEFCVNFKYFSRFNNPISVNSNNPLHMFEVCRSNLKNLKEEQAIIKLLNNFLHLTDDHQTKRDAEATTDGVYRCDIIQETISSSLFQNSKGLLSTETH